jgi:hypothetical protein
LGEAQGTQEPPSNKHSKLTLGSFDLNAKLAVVAVVVSLGRLTIEVFGGVLSAGGGVVEVTVQLAVAGVASTFPAASVARTANWCEPTASPEYAFGELQSAQARPSSRQAKVELGSLDAKAKLAVVAVVVALGPLVIKVLGGVLSVDGGTGVGVVGIHHDGRWPRCRRPRKESARTLDPIPRCTVNLRRHSALVSTVV